MAKGVQVPCDTSGQTMHGEAKKFQNPIPGDHQIGSFSTLTPCFWTDINLKNRGSGRLGSGLTRRYT